MLATDYVSGSDSVFEEERRRIMMKHKNATRIFQKIKLQFFAYVSEQSLVFQDQIQLLNLFENDCLPEARTFLFLFWYSYEHFSHFLLFPQSQISLLPARNACGS